MHRFLKYAESLSQNYLIEDYGVSRMSYYGPVGAFSPLDNEGRRGRASYSQPWGPDDIEGDLSSPGIEMRGNTRPILQDSRFSGASMHSSSSTLFPKPGEIASK